jgi:hypothetical protein
MGNFKDFDLDLKEVKNKGSNVESINTFDPVCETISLITKITAKYCSKGCPVPSIDYEHRSCRGPLNDGTIQINC